MVTQGKPVNHVDLVNKMQQLLWWLQLVQSVDVAAYSNKNKCRQQELDC